ncbi:MAG: N-acetylmannosamine-6-phosphate 2-epimerase [Candidatus Gastranaerophilales bacterium]|nr:N-acetylmannosamine-6-phosphate 2-epimerase [Candidatus Gastranaerophilales bacterium]
MSIIKKLEKEVIISVQAMPEEPLYKEECMTAMMQSVINGGAKGLRLAGARDIKNAKKLFPNIPVIGLTKPDKLPENWKEIVYITPSLKEVQELINAQADIIATDATSRPRPKESLKEILKYIKDNGKYAMADISTFEEGIKARELGFDIISTTLSGYTQYSKQDLKYPDFELLERLTKELDCPVVLEGRIWTPEEVDKAFESGAYSVVIGSAVTRPQLITKRFCERGK